MTENGINFFSLGFFSPQLRDYNEKIGNSLWREFIAKAGLKPKMKILFSLGNNLPIRVDSCVNDIPLVQWLRSLQPILIIID